MRVGEFKLRVKKSWLKTKSSKKVFEGDVILINPKAELKEGRLVFISHNEQQWIDEYKEEMSKEYNVYPIMCVYMMS